MNVRPHLMLVDLDEAPTDQAPLRLVEGGFSDKGEAEEAMFKYAAKLRMVDKTSRYGVLVRQDPGVGHWTWGVYIRDRAAGS